MKIALLSLRWCQYGGWVTYKKHLRDSLVAAGAEVDCLSLESPTGNKNWVKKTTIENVMFKYDIVHIDTVDVRKPGAYYFEIKNKLPNSVCTIHDPTEYRAGVMNLLSSNGRPLVIFIRKSMLSHNTTRSVFNHLYIPHPYKRENPTGYKSEGKVVVSTSRIDHDKNTHMILDADCGIEMWTGGINRIYEYHTLKQKMKENPDYKGPFEKPADVYKRAIALVDMSTIAGDGGGTQYTFLEAMDYGLYLLLNKGWATTKEQELIPHKHYLPVGSAEELKKAVEYLRTGKQPHPNDYEDIFKNHNHIDIGKQYIQTYTQWLNGKKFNANKGFAKFFG